MRNLVYAGWICFVVFGGRLAQAEGAAEGPNGRDEFTAAAVTASVSTNGVFERSRYEAALNNGVMFSSFPVDYHRPTINYTITEIQLGYMLTDVKGEGWLRGNFELAGEGFASAIFTGDGSFIAGATLWGRYNFVPRGWRLIPYLQLGAGVCSTDIDKNILGQPFNFNLDIGLGARYLFAERWAFNLEFRYQHISNANTGNHNLGINAVGPVLGVSYLF